MTDEPVEVRHAEARPLRWSTFPHCPRCLRRLHSLARPVLGPTPDGRCPHCRVDLGARSPQ